MKVWVEMNEQGETGLHMVKSLLKPVVEQGLVEVVPWYKKREGETPGE